MLSSRFSASPYVIGSPLDNVIVAGILTERSRYTKGDEVSFSDGTIAGDIATIAGETERSHNRGGDAPKLCSAVLRAPLPLLQISDKPHQPLQPHAETP